MTTGETRGPKESAPNVPNTERTMEERVTAAERRRGNRVGEEHEEWEGRTRPMPVWALEDIPRKRGREEKLNQGTLEEEGDVGEKQRRVRKRAGKTKREPIEARGAAGREEVARARERDKKIKETRGGNKGSKARRRDTE